MTYQVISHDNVSNLITYEQDGKNVIVLDKYIVGIFEKSKDEFSLLYVEYPESCGKNSIDLVVFKSLPVTRPSSALRERFGSKSCLVTNYEPRNIHVILSTASGGQHAEKFFVNSLKPMLSHLGLNDADNGYYVHQTDSSDSISHLVKATLLPRANKSIRQIIILLSGDGGIIDIVNEATSECLSSRYARLEVILIPLGTGNALAHSSGITADETHGLSTLLRGRPQPLPLFKVQFSEIEAIDQKQSKKQEYSIHGAVVCSWGLHAALVADSDTPECRKHGADRFKMAAKGNLFPSDGSLPHEYRAKVSILPRAERGTQEWQVLPRSLHAYVLVTLVSQLEKGFTISPHSTPLEGQLRLVHFGPLAGGGDEIMRIMGLAYQGGKHIFEESVSYHEVDGLRVEFEEDDPRFRRVCVDGKIITVTNGGSLEVRRELQDVLDLFVL